MIWTQSVCLLILGSLQAYDIVLAQGIVEGNATLVNAENVTVAAVTPADDAGLYKRFVCRGKPNGLRLPVADSCVDYYECENELAVQKTCQPGYHFSGFGLTCLDARMSTCKVNSNCAGRCCDLVDGIYPIEGSCKEYVICEKGEAAERRCGGNLEFNRLTHVCDIPERAQCNMDSGEQDPADKNILQKPVMYKISHRVCRKSHDGFMQQIFGSCNKFYLCLGGIGYLKSCGTLQFNPKMQYCDTRTKIYCPEYEPDDVILDLEGYNPSHATTEDSISDLDVTKKPSNKRPSRKPKPHGGKKTKPTSPDQIVTTSIPIVTTRTESKLNLPVNVSSSTRKLFGTTKKQQLTTPSSEHSDSAENDSSEEEKVQNVEDADEIPVLNSKICLDQPVGALLASPGDCSKYIRCRWDWYERRAPELLMCPEGMHFNAKSKHCDWPENAGCDVSFNKSM